jgi:hypothetical protein
MQNGCGGLTELRRNDDGNDTIGHGNALLRREVLSKLLKLKRIFARLLCGPASPER